MNNDYKKLYFLAFGVLTVTSVFLIVRAQVFRVTEVSPDVDKVSVISPYLEITFSKNISKDGLSVDATNDVVSKRIITDNKLQLRLSGMKVNKTYTINLENVMSVDGKKITNKSYSFVAKDIPYSRLSDEEQKAISDIQDSYAPTKSDPILNYLPYGTTDFSLEAVATDNASLVIKADLLLSAADVRSNRQASIDAYRQAVIDYIKSIKLDPNSYNIEYTVIEPSVR